MTLPLLQLEGVHTDIGAYHILHGVDLHVPKGQVTLLLGRNGAGKTTVLRTIMGLWRTARGRITFDGEAIASLPTPDIARRGIAYVPENLGIFGDLTVAENMTLAARSAKRVSHIDRARLEWIFALFPPIRTFWQHPAGLLSGGQKQMLAIARAVIEPCKLLLIDEPSKGLAPVIIQSLVSALRELKQSETTILLVEQNFEFAKQLGDTVAVVDDGRIVHAGTLAAMVSDVGLQRQFLALSLTPARGRAAP